MVTSTAQNDSGLFEPSVRDERYLPFEGAGAISSWRLELPSDLRTFDYGTITDVVLHLRLTSIDDDALRTAATASLKDVLADATARPLVRLFSLRHEFPTVWHSFVSAPAATMTSATFDLAAVRFPYFAQARAITVHSAKLLPAVKAGAPPAMGITAGQSAPRSDPRIGMAINRPDHGRSPRQMASGSPTSWLLLRIRRPTRHEGPRPLDGGPAH